MRERVFSLETEYAIAFYLQNGKDHPSKKSIVEALRHPLVERHGVTNSQFLVNGSKFHYDVGHAEWSLPECRSAYEAAVYDRAADQMLSSVLGEAEEFLASQGYKGKLLVVKNNVDAEGNTYGCHENYMAENQTRWLNFKDHLLLTTRYLIPFLVTRQIFCGTGRVGYGQKLEENIGFQIMQRADFIEEVVSKETTKQRAIVSIGRENEPLAEGNYRRLHLILADSNLSGWATYLKLGTTGIVLRMLEELAFQDIPHFLDPLKALQQISRDLSCSVRIPMRDGSKLTAIEIQQSYLNQAKNYFQSYAASNDEQQIIRLWEETLNQLETDPKQLFGKVDWVTKKCLMDRYLQRLDKQWEDLSPEESTYYKLLEMDIQYHNLSSQDGLFLRLLKSKPDRLISREKIQQAQHKPPPYTRAWIRGSAIAALRENLLDIEVDHWDKLRVNGRSVLINNPLQFFSPELYQILHIYQAKSKTSKVVSQVNNNRLSDEERYLNREMTDSVNDDDYTLDQNRNRARHRITIYSSEPNPGERLNQSLISLGYLPALLESSPNTDFNIKWGSAPDEIIEEITEVICQELEIDNCSINRLQEFYPHDDEIYINLGGRTTLSP